ncbi:MAG TPA: single-stranded DNA-binding protein [Candidatus Binataceae bacterium]|nr:single-stranded DNA-binding protein [Candidatus Binataceae bacterium]
MDECVVCGRKVPRTENYIRCYLWGAFATFHVWRCFATYLRSESEREVAESFTDQEGNKQERTEWHSIVAFVPLGEICAEHLKKGRQVFVEGRLRIGRRADSV